MPDDIKLPEPVAYCLGAPHLADSADLYLASQYTPGGEHADEWTPLYTADQVRAAVEADRARARQPDQTPPQATVVGTGIEMSVGVDVLCHAAAFHPDFWDGESGPDVPNIGITDPAVFAREVAEAINREDEDGSTLLTRMLDEAVRDAVESGCEGVDHG